MMRYTGSVDTTVYIPRIASMAFIEMTYVDERWSIVTSTLVSYKYCAMSWAASDEMCIIIGIAWWSRRDEEIPELQAPTTRAFFPLYASEDLNSLECRISPLKSS